MPQFKPFQADIQQGQEGAITTVHAAWKWKLSVALIGILLGWVENGFFSEECCMFKADRKIGGFLMARGTQTIHFTWDFP